MSDLEQSINEWRTQMLAAGIKSPVPLEELESHLREEIEQQMKSGSNEQSAFDTALQKFGPAYIIRGEFSKAGSGTFTWIKNWSVFRSTISVIGWLLLGCMFLAGVMRFDFDWNFFSFRPRWNLESLVDFCIALAAIVGIWFLAKSTRDKASRVAALLVCLFLIGFAIRTVLPPETSPQVHITGHGYSTDPAAGALIALAIERALSRHAPSPLWFRGCLTLLLFVPGIFCAWREWRRTVQKRNSTFGNQILLSS